MSQKPQISPERKTMYNVGGVIAVIGLLLFLSNFFVIAQGPEHPFDMSYNPMPGLVLRGIGGMVLMIVGMYVRSVGARGAAGSGLVLDPERAREDLKPWAQTAGGLVKDALDEIRPEAGASQAGAQPAAAPQVKVRCQQCRTLNDEDAKFCKSCASPL